MVYNVMYEADAPLVSICRSYSLVAQRIQPPSRSQANPRTMARLCRRIKNHPLCGTIRSTPQNVQLSRLKHVLAPLHTVRQHRIA